MHKWRKVLKFLKTGGYGHYALKTFKTRVTISKRFNNQLLIYASRPHAYEYSKMDMIGDAQFHF